MRRALAAWVALFFAAPASGQPSAQPADPAAALKSAATYFRTKVASHGGYVYYVSADLADRWGEGKVGPHTVFVQPPGTPAVGEAFLAAHAATGDAYYLDAAREAAEALAYGQLRSGGWDQVVHFEKPARGRFGSYRNGKGGTWNGSSLDDGQTQAALRFLIRTDRALGFKHAAIHDAATYGLTALLNAQFPNGGFPQVWTGPVEKRPVVRAAYPDRDWKTEGRVKNYWDQYTLNDGLPGTVAGVLIEADRVYKGDTYRAALEKLGDFLLLAQMPDPQPGWCQQYDAGMRPIWARKFEPPAVSGWESQDALRTLIAIARHTGRKRFLEPVPKAIAYFRKSLLPDGRVARFYELKSNRPLYMDAEYRLTYDDAAAPDHYGWKQPAKFDEIEREYDTARTGAAPPKPAADPEPAARRAARELDADGRWVSVYAGERLVGQPKFAAGFRYVSSEVFARNVQAISAFLAARRE